jgi:hypothetical protein
MHNPLDVKESDDHILEIAIHLSGLFFFFFFKAFTLGKYPLSLTVITVNSALIASDDPRQERFIVEGELT